MKIDRAVIANNLVVLDDYDLREINQKIYAKVIRQACGVYVAEDGAVEHPRCRVNYTKSIQENIDAIQSLITNRFGHLNFPAYYAGSSLFSGHTFRHKEGNTWSFGGGSVVNLAHFIMFISDGIVRKNFADAYALLEKEGIKIYGLEAYDFKIGGIRLHKFLNGRLDIICPNEELRQRLASTFKEWKDASVVEHKRDMALL